MALSDLLVKVGIDSSGFRSGISDLRSQSASLRSSMAQMAGTIRDQVKELNAMARAGKTGTDEFKKLQAQIKQNESAFKGMGKEAKYLNQQLSKMEGPKLGEMFSGISLGSIAAFAGIASAGEVIRGAIKNSSDLAETTAKVGVVFGDASGTIQQFAETAATSIGQSKQQAMDAAATFGVFGKSAGLAGSDLAKFSTDFVKLASDMASFSNTTPEEAITAIGAALRGESEPIRKYGVLLDDASMRQKAMELGIYSGSGALTAQQKILAAQALIFQQTSDAQGDFQRTSDGLANQQRILAAEFKNASAELGNALLPAALAGVQGLRGLIEVTVGVASAIKTTLPGLAAIAAGIAIYNAQALIAKVATMDMAKAKAFYTTVVTAAKNAQNLFNLAFAMSPMGRVIKIIGLAVTAFGLLYTTIKPLRDWVNNLWDSFNLFGDSAEEAAAKNDKLNKSLDNTPERIAKIRKALNELDWTKAQPPKPTGPALPGLQGGSSFSDFAKQTGMLTGPTANTTKSIQEYVKQLKEQRDELEIGSANYKKITAEITKYEKKTSSSTSTTKDAKTATDVFNDALKNIAKSEAYFTLIGDEAAILEERYKTLSNAQRAAFEAGGPYADDMVLKLKAMADAVSEARRVVEISPVQTLTAQPLQAKGFKMPFEMEKPDTSKLEGNLMRDLSKINTAAMIFGSENKLSDQIASYAQIINEGLADGLDINALQPYIDKWRELNQTMSDQQLSIGIIEQVGSVAMSTFEAIGAGSTSAAQGFAAVGKAALMASLDFLKGKLLESTGGLMKWASSLGPFGIPIATAGVGALFALVKGAIGRTKGVQLAEGGIISGRTMAEVGEYPGAAFNPEVVAPLDKLQAMLDIGGTTQVSGTFRVQGADLVLALDNAQRKMNQFRV